MATLGFRLSRLSVSGALLVSGCMPWLADAASCDTLNCLTSSQANVQVDNGAVLQVGTGGLLTDSSVSNGRINLWDSGSTLRTHVMSNGWLVLEDSSTAFDSRVEAGGTMVVAGDATALSTHVVGGDFDAAQNAVISDTQVDTGYLYVYADATAKNTRLTGGEMMVYQRGSAQQTTVNTGGLLSVLDSASVSDTLVNQGARMDVSAGTFVRTTTVNQGGIMTLADRASAYDTTINQGGLLQLKGDATLGRDSHIDGQVNFADPAINGFHTLTLEGPLIGNASFRMHTDLAALRGDLIEVQGPLSGQHTLVVADAGRAPSGAQQKLMLVDGNGGSGDFSLYGQTVDAGAFRYHLQQQGQDWYLVNLAEPAPLDPAEAVEPGEPAQPGFPVAPADSVPPAQPPRLPQAETLSKGANAAVGNQTAAASLIHAQMSATTGHFAELRSSRDKGGLWVRGYGVEQRLNTDASRAFEQHINGLEMGADKALPFADGSLYIGALIGQGQARQDFGEASKGRIDSITVGGYASYLDRSGWYVDSALKYNRLNNTLDVTSNLGESVKAHYRNHAVSAEVQAGKTFDLGRGWFVEPQAGLQVARISATSYSASNGLQVEEDSLTSVQSRVGGLFGRELHLDNGMTIRPYVKAAWVAELAGDSHVKVNGAKLDNRLPGSRTEIGGGMSVAMADNQTVYAEGSYTKGNDIEQPWAVTVGYRYNW
ncbi:outer membrane autotransporter barrel domain-containing protein [Pseudomonas vancouverensis]|uniref:Autotransporter outer membrane beta-barrel domain-containing protein n=2 Tax=Pseudomonas vancouverensis TaxID=95300 RepID=A0A1H2NZU0_PSEVA|nr:autotransporter outer membrane beta-barrel domain-containing protein [Pseudomonas vancouverensis]TDB56450.1 autotransporter outer membrane beta-barrel domain-containing protein [Pseudomonas vancouverensis]SDV10947.1 outer membrane autotransporter barrel domain-containing protein [Pseudomonas vancouverensis]